MPEITPDRSDESRCISVHWSLPVQCVLPRAHRDNWHEAWHPKSGNRMRYRHTTGSTEQLLNGTWTSLEIPPPGGYCNEQNPSNPKAFCDDRAGHSWMHRVVYDGCTYTWNSAPGRPASAEQLAEDVRSLRAQVAELTAELAEVKDHHAHVMAMAEQRVAKATELKRRLFKIGSAQTYRLESGKKFIYVEDIADAVLGRPLPEPGDPS
jgi:hypothetical protein